MSIVHRPDKDNFNADSLSGNPCKLRVFTSDWEAECSPVVSHCKAEEMALLPLKSLQKTDGMTNLEKARVIDGRKPCY